MDDINITKVRVKLGPIEVEYEGGENFFKTEIPELLKMIMELYKANSSIMILPPSQPSESTPLIPPDVPKKIEISKNSIASKLGCKTGPELILAACATLTFVKLKETFTRKEIIPTMKEASTYYKQSYVRNLGNYLSTLVKDGKLLERSNGVFALHTDIRKEMEAKIVT